MHRTNHRCPWVVLPSATLKAHDAETALAAVTAAAFFSTPASPPRASSSSVCLSRRRPHLILRARWLLLLLLLSGGAPCVVPFARPPPSHPRASCRSRARRHDTTDATARPTPVPSLHLPGVCDHLSVCMVGRRRPSQGWVVGAYLVGDAEAEDVVCVAADAPGWRAPGVRRFARRLAARGALVVTPDLWRGDTWYGDPAPVDRAKNKAFKGWASGHPTEKVASDLMAVMEALLERGAKRVSVVGMGLGAGAVVHLLSRENPPAVAHAGAVVCPIGVDAAAAAQAAAGMVPTVFVWGGGDAAAEAAAEAEKAMEGAAGEAGQGKWAAKVFADQDAHFAFAAREREDEECADEAAAADLVLEWTAHA